MNETKLGKMKLLPILFLLLTSCSYFEKNEEKEHGDELPQELFETFQTMHLDVESGLDPVTGWPSINDCDSTLFAGLACSLNMPVKIEYAEYSPGEIHRRPYKACWNEKEGDVGSKTTISRDMLTGYIACALARNDKPAMERLFEYGKRNEWIMGKPRFFVSRVLLTPNMIGTLGRFLNKEGYKQLPTSYSPVTEDYERHIQVQGILNEYKVSGSISDSMLDRLKANKEAEPLDPLFSAAYGLFSGDQKETVNLLMETGKCPTYARGEKPEVYCKLNWLQAASIVMGKK